MLLWTRTIKIEKNIVHMTNQLLHCLSYLLHMHAENDNKL
jgi:DNA-binding winged helix-turn-helix (wHTH) protein